ncbi:hypothetical protein NDK43_06950 [Neobacillus pocheonensis]|uniref:DUF4328 domain-containing protein n=1 Tax=Neobacillus pocheonensis TaxID=363869 RepID=A0ABT0W790_9BACI|nr:hypothetical protein [Neobacillus pocheonensis]
MKFETKYLIRWGIPGWVLIFWVFYGILFVKGINPLENNLAEISKGFTLLISLAAIGVPIGYILHQFYFGVIWVKNMKHDFNDAAEKVGDKFPKHSDWLELNDQNYKQNKKVNPHGNYYQFEYVWHSVLLKMNSETRTYVEGRYRHILGTIHGLGALGASSALSMVASAVIFGTDFSNHSLLAYIFLIIGIIIQIIIFVSAIYNYKYFSDNLRAFQIKMLKTYL